ncbi:MAG TPA: transposase [Terriglobales bacterium]|nr:transposase [Terriglobales bacterium]
MLLLNARDLTDLQWAILDAYIPEPPRRKDRRGRPWTSRRSVLNGILWGASAPALLVLEALAEDLQIRGRLDVREAFIDGSFAPALRAWAAAGPKEQASLGHYLCSAQQSAIC